MDVTPLIRKDAQVIQSYKGGVFKISNQTYATSIVVMPSRVIPFTGEFTDLIPYRDEIEVLLFGTGDKFIMPSLSVKKEVKELLGMTLEFMDNGAASRTYNVLMAEGRKVAAILTIS